LVIITVINSRMENVMKNGICTYIVIASAFAASAGFADASNIETTSFHACGRSDTQELQAALDHCSNSGDTCVIPAGKKYIVDDSLYIWGAGSLKGESATSEIFFSPTRAVSLLHVGVKGPYRSVQGDPANIKPAFSGTISGITFRIDPAIYAPTNDGDTTPPDPAQINAGDATRRITLLPVEEAPSSRLIYFWRTSGASLIGNQFFLNYARYSATSSGNYSYYLYGNNYIRKNLKIIDNTIDSKDFTYQSVHGNEGIGLNGFDGARIEGNTIRGVADDIIGIHFSTDVLIRGNVGDGTKGAVYTASSRCVAIMNNSLTRRAHNGGGMELIELGFESGDTPNDRPPTQHVVTGNQLFFPVGTNNAGSAIKAWSPRAVKIAGNFVDFRGTAPAPAGFKGIYIESVQNSTNVTYDSVTDDASFTGLAYGCFADSSILPPGEAPQNYGFMPTNDDQYNLIPGTPGFAKARTVKNITIENNDLDAGLAGSTALSISFTGAGAWGHFMGPDVMKNEIKVRNNRISSLPYLDCYAPTYSNLANPGCPAGANSSFYDGHYDANVLKVDYQGNQIVPYGE
jgi:hypothetical protein